MRSLIHRFVPSHFHNPFGLASRLIRSGDPAARFAMFGAAAGLLATPLDLLLSVTRERRYLREATSPARPLIFICGPPRSGTTCVYQTLVEHLAVDFFSNLTSIFPKAPLTAQSRWGRRLKRSDSDYTNFYGKTNRLSGTNDALYLWDRWLGHDRSQPPTSMSDLQAQQMQRFFAACEQVYAHPICSKNNSLNASAHLVARHLETATFICLSRDRQSLAESLYRARCDIHGSANVPYGLSDPESRKDEDAVTSVCGQVNYFNRLAQLQQERIGKDRFRIVRYEEFCQRPDQFIEQVADDILQDRSAIRTLPQPLQVSARKRVEDEIASRIQEQFVASDSQQEDSVAVLGTADRVRTE